MPRDGWGLLCGHLYFPLWPLALLLLEPSFYPMPQQTPPLYLRHNLFHLYLPPAGVCLSSIPCSSSKPQTHLTSLSLNAVVESEIASKDTGHSFLPMFNAQVCRIDRGSAAVSADCKCEGDKAQRDCMQAFSCQCCTFLAKPQILSPH